jgi:hypothetical protein
MVYAATTDFPLLSVSFPSICQSQYSRYCEKVVDFLDNIPHGWEKSQTKGSLQELDNAFWVKGDMGKVKLLSPSELLSQQCSVTSLWTSTLLQRYSYQLIIVKMDASVMG